MNTDIPRDHLVPAPVIPNEAKPYLIAYLEWLGNDEGAHGGLYCRWDRNEMIELAHRMWLTTVDLDDPHLQIPEGYLGMLTTDQIERRAQVVANNNPRSAIEEWASRSDGATQRLYQRALGIADDDGTTVVLTVDIPPLASGRGPAPELSPEWRQQSAGGD